MDARPPMQESPLTQFLYQMSLEPPHQWIFTAGSRLNHERVDIGALASFVAGFQRGVGVHGEPGWDPFLLWLRDEAGVFTQRGWAAECLEREGGDHQRAIQLFFDYLHEYLLLRRPPWFIRFNEAPRPSSIVTGLGTPTVGDVRKREHVQATNGQTPGTTPDIRIKAFSLGDGYVLRLGLPTGVATWWTGLGSRTVYFNSDLPEDRQVQLNRSLAGGLGSLPDLLNAATAAHVDAGGHAFEGCVIDGFRDRVEVACRGGAGAALVRNGLVVAETASGDPTLSIEWPAGPRDHLILFSNAVGEHILGLGLGPLPTALASCEPLAWAQCVRTQARQLAVDLFWAPPTTVTP